MKKHMKLFTRRALRMLCALIVAFMMLFIGTQAAMLVTGSITTACVEYSRDLPRAMAEAHIDGALNSPQAILVRLSDRGILYQQNEDERTYPASLTKIMTALVAIENIDAPKETITLPESIFGALYAENASMAGFQPGEKVRVVDLLYGSMLPSGAEASIGLAIAVAGSEAAFVEMMNERARELNMTGTHYANATGLHDAAHYTTVKDTAILLAYALKNKTFRNAFTADRYLTQPTNLHKDGITVRSTLFSRLDTRSFSGGAILGGKTGYTSAAGQCLASLAEKNGEEYIFVTTGAEKDDTGTQYNIRDAVYAYENLAY